MDLAVTSQRIKKVIFAGCTPIPAQRRCSLGLTHQAEPSMEAPMVPSICTAAAGGARLELPVDLHFTPHVHAASCNYSTLPYGGCCQHSAWRFMLDARLRTTHFSSARACWQER